MISVWNATVPVSFCCSLRTELTELIRVTVHIVAQCRIYYFSSFFCPDSTHSLNYVRDALRSPRTTQRRSATDSEICKRQANTRTHTHTHTHCHTHTHTLTLALKLCSWAGSLITHCQPLIYPNFLTNFDHYDGCAIKIKIHAPSLSLSQFLTLPPSLSLSLSVSGQNITRSLTSTAYANTIAAEEFRVCHNKRCPLTMSKVAKSKKKK